MRRTALTLCLLASAAFGARILVAMQAPAANYDESRIPAYTLPDPYRSKISVVDTTTGGMGGDYASGTICSAATSSPDAVYKFRPYEVAIQQNAGQQVVEVVRDPARQAPHDLQLFRLVQPVFNFARVSVRKLADRIHKGSPQKILKSKLRKM